MDGIERANRRRNRRVAVKYPMFASEFAESMDDTAARISKIKLGWAVARERICSHNALCADRAILLRDAVLSRAMGGVALHHWTRRAPVLDTTFGIGGDEYSYWKGWALRLRIFDDEFWVVENGQWRGECCRLPGWQWPGVGGR